MNLIIPLVGSTLKRNLVKILLLTCLIPLLLFIASLFSDDLLRIEGGDISFLSFSSLLFSMMHTIFIPVALVIQLGVAMFYEEKSKELTYFYKDISRGKIYFSKLSVILLTYLVYCFVLFAVLVFTYFVVLSSDSRYSGDIFGATDKIDFLVLVISFLSDIIAIQIGVSLALKFGPAYSILGAFFYFVVSNISLRYELVGQLFIEYYVSADDFIHSYVNAFVIFTCITILLQYRNMSVISKMEY